MRNEGNCVIFSGQTGIRMAAALDKLAGLCRARGVAVQWDARENTVEEQAKAEFVRLYSLDKLAHDVSHLGTPNMERSLDRAFRGSQMFHFLKSRAQRHCCLLREMAHDLPRVRRRFLSSFSVSSNVRIKSASPFRPASVVQG